MKAERRHELQTNDLAQALANFLERYRSHGPTILWCVVAAMAVFVAVSLWSTRRGTYQARAWEEFDQVRMADAKVRPKRLKDLVDRYAGTDIANWARLDLADQLCFEGRSKMELDRGVASSQLQEAQENYAKVLEDPAAKPEMIRRAALADAKCWELMGDRDKAIESYHRVSTKFAAMLPELASDAAARAAELEKPDAAEFYKWFAEYKPPASKSLPTPGAGLGFPPADQSSETPSGDSKKIESETTAKPSDQPPAAEAAKTPGTGSKPEPQPPQENPAQNEEQPKGSAKEPPPDQN